MRDRDLYTKILNLPAPWSVVDVEVDLKGDEVRVRLEVDATADLQCAECGRVSARRDSRVRKWRHLDTCQLRTVLVAAIPRVECTEHGIHQVEIPWAEPRSGFTALFEALTIDWLREASIKAVAERLRLTWDQVDGIQSRAVARGLKRRQRAELTHLGVDETSFQKRHEYVTVLTDQVSGHVVHVADDRKQATLEGFLEALTPQEREKIVSVAMDMWGPYIAAVKAKVPGAEAKIKFDKFHVASHLGDGVNDVRKQEHRALLEQGDKTLSRTKHMWLQNPTNMKAERWEEFAPLRMSALKTARAWALKETAMKLWNYRSPGWAGRSGVASNRCAGRPA
jgi:transposase